jgi:hypothetical protein
MIHEAIIILTPPAFGKSTLFHAMRMAVDSAAVDTDMGLNVVDADNVIPAADAFKQAAIEKDTKVIENVCLIANRTVVFTSNPLLAVRLSDAAISAFAQHIRERLVVRGILITPCPFRRDYDEVNTFFIQGLLRKRSLDAIEWMTPALTGHIYAPSEQDRSRTSTSIEVSAFLEASSWMSLARTLQVKLRCMKLNLGYSADVLAWIDKPLLANDSNPHILTKDAVRPLLLNDKSSQASSFLCVSLMLHLICVNLVASNISNAPSHVYHRDMYVSGMPTWAVDALASLTVRNVERTLCGRGPIKRFSDLHTIVEDKAVSMVRSLAMSTDCLERSYNYWQSMISRITTRITHPSTRKE